MLKSVSPGKELQEINRVPTISKKQVQNITTRPIDSASLHNVPLAQRLKIHVEALCKIPRFSTHQAGMNEAVDYIKNAWNEIGLGDRVEEQKFNATIPGTDITMSCRNIIVSLGPKDGERIVIGGHYDTDGIPLNSERGNSEMMFDEHLRKNPGADDNASAVAGVLETGRQLKDIESELFKRNVRVDLVAYANEECPFYWSEGMGSFVHAKSLKDQGAKVKGMISYEMIGYFDEKEGSQGFLQKAYKRNGLKLPWYLWPIDFMLKSLFPSTGNFIAVVGNWASRKLTKEIKAGMSENSSIDVRSVALPSKILPIIANSDHWSYWQHGYPAVMVTDTAYLRNDNYHKPTDTPDTLNYTKMAEVVKGVVGFVRSS